MEKREKNQEEKEDHLWGRWWEIKLDKQGWYRFWRTLKAKQRNVLPSCSRILENCGRFLNRRSTVGERSWNWGDGEAAVTRVRALQ